MKGSLQIGGVENGATVSFLIAPRNSLEILRCHRYEELCIVYSLRDKQSDRWGIIPSATVYHHRTCPRVSFQFTIVP